MKTLINQYHSFLLRIWITGTPEEKSIRATLEDPFTHTISGYSSLETLFDYLYRLAHTNEAGGSSGSNQLPRTKQ
jgi:ADP-heptose:LPS heptosyltransferase